jgi:putative membrane protein
MTHKLTLTAWIAGIFILVTLVIFHGTATVMAAVAAAGWGLLAVTAFHLVPMTADTIAWRYLLEPETRPRFYKLLWMRWIGESVNSLLPAAQIGGDLIRGRLAAQRGVPTAQAAASIIVDLTLSIFTLMIFAAIGVMLVIRGDDNAFIPMISALLLSIAVIAIVLKLQHMGMFQVLATLLGRFINHHHWDKVVGGAEVLDRAVAKIYTRTQNLGASTVWAFFAWMLGAGEIWLAFYFLGHPVGILEAVMLESLIQAIRSAVFPVPGAWGVQEGGLIAIGLLAAVPAELALAVSLIKRVRELGLGLPGIIAWQYSEGRRWSLKRARD